MKWNRGIITPPSSAIWQVGAEFFAERKKMLQIREIKKEDRDDGLIAQLCTVWETSVRETHLFLSEDQIRALAPFVPQMLCGVEHLVVAFVQGHPAAFMGTEEHRLEMLFIAPAYRGKGLGKQLVQMALGQYQVQEVTVNEQNPQAVGFYQHMGFSVFRRTPEDEMGNPYPILYMQYITHENR